MDQQEKQRILILRSVTNELYSCICDTQTGKEITAKDKEQLFILLRQMESKISQLETKFNISNYQTYERNYNEG